MMTKIWRDRLAKYDVYHTGALLRSVTPGNVNVHDMQGSISFRFLQYGVYVDAGTGKGYTRGNDGNLEFLGAAYRRQRGLGKPRQRKPWFSVSWRISVEVIKEEFARRLGTRFALMFDNLNQ